MLLSRKQALAVISTLALLVLSVWEKSALSLPVFLSDDQQLSLPASGAMNFRKIRTLSLHDGAAVELLGTPIRFPNLKQIGLSSSEANGAYLRELLDNYPRLSAIRIDQKASLDEESIKRIANFDVLTNLDLDCPMSNNDLLIRSLPASLRCLSLGPKNSLTLSTFGGQLELPRLVKLDIRGSSVERSFFRKLRTPKLHKIALINVKAASGSLYELAAFSELRIIEMYKVEAKDEEVDFLRNQHIQIKRR
jgi:hypothetical protein